MCTASLVALYLSPLSTLSIPPVIIYDLAPRRRHQHDVDLLTLFDQRISRSSQTSQWNDSRHLVPESYANQPSKTMSSHLPIINSTVTTVLACPSKSNDPMITTWKISYIDVFEYCRDSYIFTKLKV